MIEHIKHVELILPDGSKILRDIDKPRDFEREKVWTPWRLASGIHQSYQRLIALEISNELGEAVIVSKVNGTWADLTTSLNRVIADPNSGTLKVQFYSWDNPEGKDTLWHSSSHVLGLALEQYPFIF